MLDPGWQLSRIGDDGVQWLLWKALGGLDCVVSGRTVFMSMPLPEPEPPEEYAQPNGDGDEGQPPRLPNEREHATKVAWRHVGRCIRSYRDRPSGIGH